ncbi:hypothetical protein C0995_012269 [Termitomyces sp. Mi166|nr:hypothetical protein C0995_012269 [Termitomyces sp. Mi166\
MQLPRNKAVDLIDFCVPPFVNTGTSSDSEAPSKAAQGVPQSRQVSEIRRDRMWMEDLVTWTREKLGDEPVNCSSEDVPATKLFAYHLLAAAAAIEKPQNAHSETVQNERTSKHIFNADMFLRSLFDKGHGFIEAELQESTWTVKPYVDMKLTSNDKVIGRFDDKAILVQFYYAEELEQTTSTKYTTGWTLPIQSIYKQVIIQVSSMPVTNLSAQVYAPTQPTELDGSPCKKVRMENDALYRWGYIVDRSLVVSDWRSVDKEVAEVILKDAYPSTPSKVMQGHPVLENIAIYFLKHRT